MRVRPGDFKHMGKVTLPFGVRSIAQPPNANMNRGVCPCLKCGNQATFGGEHLPQ